jgi:hypothetical protein
VDIVYYNERFSSRPYIGVYRYNGEAYAFTADGRQRISVSNYIVSEYIPLIERWVNEYRTTEGALYTGADCYDSLEHAVGAATISGRRAPNYVRTIHLKEVQ